MITSKDYIDEDLREFIHNRDEGKCQICGKQGKWFYMGRKRFAGYRTDVGYIDIKYAWRRFHVDHIIPENIGGETVPENLRLTCPKCNLRRSKYGLDRTAHSIDKTSESKEICPAVGNTSGNGGRTPDNALE